MPGKIEVLSILLILLPGLLAVYISQQLAVRREQSDFDKVVEALVFSFVLYLVTLPAFSGLLPVSWQPLGDGSFHVAIAYRHLLLLFGLSVLLGVLHAANANHDWLHLFLRWSKITERSARRSIWKDVFHRVGGYVQVSIKDGKRVVGWLTYYSDQAEDSSLFLEDAVWIGDDGEEQRIDGPGVLLTKDCGIETVMFLSWSTSDSKPPAPSQAD